MKKNDITRYLLAGVISDAIESAYGDDKGFYDRAGIAARAAIYRAFETKADPNLLKEEVAQAIKDCNSDLALAESLMEQWDFKLKKFEIRRAA